MTLIRLVLMAAIKIVFLIKMKVTSRQGLGIMIIEGSHKATGTGIFVSDIQERSAAFHVSLSFLSLSLFWTAEERNISTNI